MHSSSSSLEGRSTCKRWVMSYDPCVGQELHPKWRSLPLDGQWRTVCKKWVMGYSLMTCASASGAAP